MDGAIDTLYLWAAGLMAPKTRRLGEIREDLGGLIICVSIRIREPLHLLGLARFVDIFGVPARSVRR